MDFDKPAAGFPPADQSVDHGGHRVNPPAGIVELNQEPYLMVAIW